jgi:hypothetical protein
VSALPWEPEHLPEQYIPHGTCRHCGRRFQLRRSDWAVGFHRVHATFDYDTWPPPPCPGWAKPSQEQP